MLTEYLFIPNPVKVKIKNDSLLIASVRFGDGTYWNFASGASKSRATFLKHWKKLWDRYKNQNKRTHVYIQNGKLRFT